MQQMVQKKATKRDWIHIFGAKHQTNMLFAFWRFSVLTTGSQKYKLVCGEVSQFLDQKKKRPPLWPQLANYNIAPHLFSLFLTLHPTSSLFLRNNG
jgi:hypothetical protein